MSEDFEQLLGKRGNLSTGFLPFDKRNALNKWMVAQGLPPKRLHKMRADTMVKCYNNQSFLASIIRAEVRKARGPLGSDPDPVTPSSGIDEDRVREIVHDAIEHHIPIPPPQPFGAVINEAAVVELIKKHASSRVIEVRQPDHKPVKIAGRQHPVFERVLRLTRQGLNILLVGPAGCGKTYMAEQIAKALDLDYGAIHGTAGASESALTGWLLPSTGGKFEYTPAPFVQLFEDGDSLFLFDEMDAFDPNMLLVVNGALANDALHIAHRRGKPVVKKGKGAHIMATANTYGTGANPMYAGRSALDNATLDRFTVVTVDYDEGLERDIASSGGLTDMEMRDIWQLRRRVREAQLRRVVSTRAFQKACNMKRAGDDWKTVVSTLVEGWSRDEKTKAGITA